MHAIKTTPPVAPSYPLSPTDKAAHAAASFVRPALPVRVDDSGLSRAGKRALRSAEVEAAYLEREQQLAAEFEMAEVA